MTLFAFLQALPLLAQTSTTPPASTPAPEVPLRLNSVLQTAADADCLVLQGNFSSGSGQPVLAARIYGNKTVGSMPAPVTIKAVPGSPAISLSGTNLDLTARTLTPVIASNGMEWQWTGTFVVTGTGAAHARVEISGLAQESVSAYLGDVWIVQGGENVGVETSIATTGSMQIRAVKAEGESPGLVIALSGTPGSRTVTTPAISGRFAADLFQSLDPKRPIAVYSVSRSEAFYSDWSSDKFWPRLGWENERSAPTARGLIFWMGEWDAEYGKMPVWEPGKSTDRSWFHDLRKWQDTQSRNLQNVIVDLSSRTAPVEAVSPSPQVQLVVQLQDVNRQPEHLKLVNPDLESPWELQRAAQTDAVLNLRSNHRIKLVPAVPVERDMPVAGGSPWFWDPGKEDGRFTGLAKRLAKAAVAEMTGNVAPPPAANWSSPEEVVISLPGDWSNRTIAVQLVTTSLSGTGGAPYWTSGTNIVASGSAMKISSQDLQAVRYRAGDAPAALQSTTNGVVTEEVLPVFRFYRP